MCGTEESTDPAKLRVAEEAGVGLIFAWSVMNPLLSEYSDTGWWWYTLPPRWLAGWLFCQKVSAMLHVERLPGMTHMVDEIGINPEPPIPRRDSGKRITGSGDARFGQTFVSLEVKDCD